MGQLQELVDAATNEGLREKHEAKNKEICELLETNSNSVSIELAQLLYGRIKDIDTRVVKWTLELTAECMRHGNRIFYEQFCKTRYMSELTSIADGYQGEELQQRAIELIQDWGMGFVAEQGPLALFRDTYTQLKLQGVKFRPAASASFNYSALCVVDERKPAAAVRHEDQRKPSSAMKGLEKEFKKLHEDLGCVEDKIALCQELSRHRSEETAEALEDVVDFLTQCVPRMNTLIEAGLNGKLDEETLERCLKVNDNLVKTLDGDNTETEQAQQSNLIDMDFDTSQLSQPMAQLSTGPSSTPPPAPAPAPATSSASAAPKDDDWDGK